MLGSRLCCGKNCTCTCTSPPPPLPPKPKWDCHERWFDSPTPPFPVWIIALIVCVLIIALVIMIGIVIYRRLRQKKQQQIGDHDCEMRSKNGSTASTRDLVNGNGNASSAIAAEGPAKEN